MKHLPVVIALAASCVVSNFCHVAHAAPTQNLAAEVVPSLEKYQLNMIEGRKNKAESAKSYSQSKSQLAALAFFRARDFALTSPQRGEALVEAGESLSPMAAMTDAIAAFRDALKEQISPELKGRALMGIADSEYHVAFMRGELAKYATILRNNYLEATKIHKASDGEMAKIWQNLAKSPTPRKSISKLRKAMLKFWAIKVLSICGLTSRAMPLNNCKKRQNFRLMTAKLRLN